MIEKFKESTSHASKNPLVVTCPQCGKEHQWDTGNRFRPFCSKRCKLIDLGRWANEEYRVEQRTQDSTEENSMPDTDHQA